MCIGGKPALDSCYESRAGLIPIFLRYNQLYGLMLIMIFKQTDKLSVKQAEKIIRGITSHGTIIFSRHAKSRMMKRGYSSHDVEYILLHGKVVRQEFNDKTKTWVYKVCGADLEGDDGAVIVSVIKRMSAVIITVLG
jgi:hypothetical protein